MRLAQLSELDDFFAGFDVVEDPESLVEEAFFSVVDDPLSELLDDDPLSELLDDDPLSEPLEESDEPGGVVAFEPRLSVLKKPDPLKVTPTGWKTFFTESTSPDSGWVYSVRVSSVNACWTSMVSPVSTNL